ncbi:TPA_inf: hypothetical protein gp_09 [Marinomonas phage YY]|nr:TPA_inf: hypothetical protein gp_09 [Marinomonas phage YY]
MAGETPLSFSLAPSSSAATGSDMTSQDFDFSFGDKIAGEGANSGSSAIAPVIKDVATGMIVAVLGKLVYDWMFK